MLMAIDTERRLLPADLEVSHGSDALPLLPSLLIQDRLHIARVLCQDKQGRVNPNYPVTWTAAKATPYLPYFLSKRNYRAVEFLLRECHADPLSFPGPQEQKSNLYLFHQAIISKDFKAAQILWEHAADDNVRLAYINTTPLPGVNLVTWLFLAEVRGAFGDSQTVSR